MTDNRNRTASNVRSYFTKSGGDLGQTGSVSFMFDRVGEIVYPLSAGDADTVMLAALEAGADDVQSDDEGHWIYCADTALNEVSSALEASLGEIRDGEADLEAAGPDRDHRSRDSRQADEADRRARG